MIWMGVLGGFLIIFKRKKTIINVSYAIYILLK